MNHVFVFGLTHEVGTLRERLASGLTMYRNPLIEREFTMEECREIVMAILEELLTERFLWVGAHGRHIDRVVQKFFPAYQSSGAGSSSHSWDFFDQFIDPTVMVLTDWIHIAIPKRTWCVWHTKIIHGDLLLERGEDFRVVDWTRRKERGEFDHG